VQSSIQTSVPACVCERGEGVGEGDGKVTGIQATERVQVCRTLRPSSSTKPTALTASAVASSVKVTKPYLHAAAREI
jgi:hypothetical protein